jgi:hypothetical protein
MTPRIPVDLIADLARDTGQDPNELRVKFDLARRLHLRMEDAGITPLQLKGLTEIDAEDISAICAYQVRIYPLWTILKLLTAAGMDVAIGVNEGGKDEAGLVYVVDDE